jgi:hypothetical protein
MGTSPCVLPLSNKRKPRPAAVSNAASSPSSAVKVIERPSPVNFSLFDPPLSHAEAESHENVRYAAETAFGSSSVTSGSVTG